MGTRRSRHNKGRKVEKHQQIQKNCALCSSPVFVAARHNAKQRQHLCNNCARGDHQEPVEFYRPSTLKLESGEMEFLRCAEAKSLTVEAVSAMSESDCASLFERIRYSDNGGVPQCRCGSTRLYKITTRNKFNCAECSAQFSSTSGTVFASRKLTFRAYLTAMALVYGGPSGMSITDMAERLGVQYRTVYQIAIDLRSAIATEAAPEIPTPDDAPKFSDGGAHATFTRWSRDDTAL
jgi:transposase-like protein